MWALIRKGIQRKSTLPVSGWQLALLRTSRVRVIVVIASPSTETALGPRKLNPVDTPAIGVEMSYKEILFFTANNKNRQWTGAQELFDRTQGWMDVSASGESPALPTPRARAKKGKTALGASDYEPAKAGSSFSVVNRLQCLVYYLVYYLVYLVVYPVYPSIHILLLLQIFRYKSTSVRIESIRCHAWDGILFCLNYI